MSDPATPTPYYLVVAVEGEPAFLREYPDREGLVSFLRDHFHPETGARVQVFIFQGVRLHITTGGSKYLLQGSEPPTPLFHPPDPHLKPSESGDWFDEPPPGQETAHGYTSYPGGPLGDDEDA